MLSLRGDVFRHTLLQTLKERAKVAEAALASAQAEVKRLESAVASLEEERDKMAAEAQAAQAALKQAEDRAREMEERLNAQIAALQAEAAAAAEKTQALERQVRETEARAQKALAEAEAREVELKAARGEVRQLMEAVKQLEIRCAQAEQAAVDAQAEVAKAEAVAEARYAADLERVTKLLAEAEQSKQGLHDRIAELEPQAARLAEEEALRAVLETRLNDQAATEEEQRGRIAQMELRLAGADELEVELEATRQSLADRESQLRHLQGDTSGEPMADPAKELRNAEARRKKELEEAEARRKKELEEAEARQTKALEEAEARRKKVLEELNKAQDLLDRMRLHLEKEMVKSKEKRAAIVDEALKSLKQIGSHMTFMLLGLRTNPVEHVGTQDAPLMTVSSFSPTRSPRAAARELSLLSRRERTECIESLQRNTWMPKSNDLNSPAPPAALVEAIVDAARSKAENALDAQSKARRFNMDNRSDKQPLVPRPPVRPRKAVGYPLEVQIPGETQWEREQDVDRSISLPPMRRRSDYPLALEDAGTLSGSFTPHRRRVSDHPLALGDAGPLSSSFKMPHRQRVMTE